MAIEGNRSVRGLLAIAWGEKQIRKYCFTMEVWKQTHQSGNGIQMSQLSVLGQLKEV